MKTQSRIATLSLLTFATLGLGACASTREQAYRAPPPPKPGSVQTDSAYVAYVESVARRRGIDVQWVNKPTRRVAKQ